MKLLVVTNKRDDAHADFVIEALTERGYGDAIVRLNTEDFATNTSIRFDGSDIHVDILDSGCSFSTADVGVVWFRRPQKIELTHDDDGVKDYIFNQYNAVLEAIYLELEKRAFWLNSRTAMRNADAKLEQLLRAKSLGFNIPCSFVLNNHKNLSTVKKVIGSRDLCMKSLKYPYYHYDDNLYSLLTRKVCIAQLEAEAAAIDVCPVYLQEYIDKMVDIRVVIFGDEVHAFKLFSQEDELSIEDFRGIAPHLIKHEYIRLPDDMNEKLVSFVQSYGLFYSAIDLVLDKNGKIYFIENNPNGQWLWLELLTEIKLSNRFINVIIEHLDC